jgi:Zn-finger nucleic acid-binding protein
MPRPIDPCPICASPLVSIRLSDQLAMRSCSRCERRWWRRGGDDAPLTSVLADVSILGRRRRAS